jgi:putative transcriptional regulator
MALRYKKDILEALKEKGLTSYRIRTERIFGERQLQQLRNGEIVSNACLDRLCGLLQCQPGDLLEYIPEE